MSQFKRLEDGAPLTAVHRKQLKAFCLVMCRSLAELVTLANSTLELRDVEDLQLLTLGSYYYGSLNNTIGQTAILGVFTALSETLGQQVTRREKDWFSFATAAGRTFQAKVASDPDLRIVEVIGDRERPVVSIEVKGGTDKSNVYNRGGEAEKSHQGAKNHGFKEC